MALDPDQILDGAQSALAAASREQQWPDRMQLPDAVDELSGWLEDERQWSSALVNWNSLVDDVIAALSVLGPQTQQEIDAPNLIAEVKECRGKLNTRDTRFDPALRRRLRGLVSTIRERCRRPATIAGAWRDLTSIVANPDMAADSAHQMIALREWFGHDGNAFTSAIQGELRADQARHEGEDPPPAHERLSAVEELVQLPPRQEDMVVWLRYIFAPLRTEWIDLGDAVRIYRGDWLRAALHAPAAHQDLPPEATGDAGWLKTFCAEYADADERERPVAYVRVALGKEMPALAVSVAQDTAETISSLGVLYGAEPTTWILDNSHLSYADGQIGGMSSRPPVAERPSFRERIAVEQDRTAEGLQKLAGRLGPHLPVRDPNLRASATLLGWMREARTSPAPLKLVLFDRVIESVCGWAGVQSVPGFIRETLLPRWAYARIRTAIANAGLAAVWNDRRSSYPAGTPEREAWFEIVNHPPLHVDMSGEASNLSLQGVLTEIQWLLDHVEAGSDNHRALTTIAERTATGEATARWWDELCADARRMEDRRKRTRNALVHGGPLAPATVAAVAVFAEHLASEALAACVDGQFQGVDLIDHFLERTRRMTDLRSRLGEGTPASEALFWED